MKRTNLLIRFLTYACLLTSLGILYLYGDSKFDQIYGSNKHMAIALGLLLLAVGVGSQISWSVVNWEGMSTAQRHIAICNVSIFLLETSGFFLAILHNSKSIKLIFNGNTSILLYIGITLIVLGAVVVVIEGIIIQKRGGISDRFIKTIWGIGLVLFSAGGCGIYYLINNNPSSVLGIPVRTIMYIAIGIGMIGFAMCIYVNVHNSYKEEDEKKLPIK